jgi:hypothetical protein
MGRAERRFAHLFERRQKMSMAEDPGWGERVKRYRLSKTLFFWSCVACAIATIVVGFKWGGWVTGGGAAEMASQAADKARAEMAAAICISRFEKAPDATAQLAALGKAKDWERGSFIEKGGWVTIPGTKKPVSGAADLCAKNLVAAKLPVVSTGNGKAS